MTDHNREEREALIEKTAKALYEANWGDDFTFQEDRDYWMGQARAALAVFEQAHTPTSDEREVLHRKAAARAEKAYPPLNPDDEVLSYPRSALRQYKRRAYVTGFEDGFSAGFRRTVQGDAS